MFGFYGFGVLSASLGNFDEVIGERVALGAVDKFFLATFFSFWIYSGPNFRFF